MNVKAIVIRLLTAASFLTCGVTRAQTLVYALSYTDTAAGTRARFANAPPPGQRSEAQDIAMLRLTRKNEIYGVSITDGKRSLLFSDEGLHLEIKPWGAVSGIARALTTGIWHGRDTPTPGYSGEGIYVLSLDGSHQFRMFAASQDQERPVLNPQGTKAAVMVHPDNDKYIASIYSVPDGKLLASLDVAKLMRARCPACNPAPYGWLADGNRLFVVLDEGDEDNHAAKTGHPGIYILSGEGADLGSISAETGAFQLAGYFRPKFFEREFRGQLPDGRYLFLDFARKQGKTLGQPEPFLVVSGVDSKPQKQFPLKFTMGECYVSPGGKYLAYLEQRQTPDYRGEPHLWIKDLESGEEKDLLSVPPPSLPNSLDPSVTLFVLGWIDK